MYILYSPRHETVASDSTPNADRNLPIIISDILPVILLSRSVPEWNLSQQFSRKTGAKIIQQFQYYLVNQIPEPIQITLPMPWQRCSRYLDLWWQYGKDQVSSITAHRCSSYSDNRNRGDVFPRVMLRRRDHRPTIPSRSAATPGDRK